MQIDFLIRVLQVPTRTHHEQMMVQFLRDHFRERGIECWSDRFNNVYAVKDSGRSSEPLPCVAAHIDSVQPLQTVDIVAQDGMLVGEWKGKRIGFGADDKAGVAACLEIIENTDRIAGAFFAAEEIGCVGSGQVDPRFMARIGYMLEFDCPSHGMLSYTSAGYRLFENRGLFIHTAFPVLIAGGTVLWQHHPYSDVMAIRRAYPISCLNLSCGYYNWHQNSEFVRVNEVDMAVAQGLALVNALGHKRYPCACGNKLMENDDKPLLPITGLIIPDFS